ncbi:MAG: amidohydrolase family protein, partial [Oscillospiraceae bacterium]
DFKDNELLSFKLAPHAPYTCDDEFFKIVANRAEKENLGIHVHLSESETEVENCIKAYGCTPIALAEKTGLFAVPCVAAHCVKATDEDIAILKKHNVYVATNPASNMKLGNGFAPLAKMLSKGVNVCLGTDGAASNNSLNMFREMQLVSLVHKGANLQAECVSSSQTFNMATKTAAAAMGLGDKVGTLEVGKKADIAILNLNTPSM